MDPGSLRSHVRDALARHAAGAGSVVVAVSGGPDSVALLRICCELRGDPSNPAGVHAAHFDHGLRPESAQEAAFVRDLAESLNVPYHGGHAPVASISRERGWNLADGARKLRYEFLSRAAREAGADAILTGHTRDDQAETVLHQLARGTAYACGMPPRRGRVVRPLLEVARNDLIAYLETLGQDWLEDPSNRDPERLRPWLRHEILPRLEDRVPGVRAALARHAEIQREVQAFVRDEVIRRFGDPPLPVDRLAAASVALQREAIARLLASHAAPTDFGFVERIRERLGATEPFRMDVGEGVVVRIAYGRLDVVPQRPEPPEERPVRGPEDLPDGAPPDLLRQDGPLTLRSRQPGDVIRLPGGSKKLADLLVDRKVPREVRDALPLVARGSDVLWIEGVATAEGVQPAPDAEQEAMDQALDLARRGGAVGELPVGAVVLLDGEVVSRAHNEGEGSGDPTAHAEVLALRRAAAAVGRHRLSDATLVVTLEPCPMCLGAVLQAHVGRVVYGAANTRDGALGGVTDLTLAPWKRTVAVRGGVRAAAAASLLREFFGARR